MFTIRSRLTSTTQINYQVEQFIDDKSQFPVAINGEHMVTIGLSYQSPPNYLFYTIDKHLYIQVKIPLSSYNAMFEVYKIISVPVTFC